MSRQPGIGLDVGTMFLVSASMDKDGNVSTRSVRDAFLEMKPSNALVKNIMIKGFHSSGISFLEMDDGTLQVLGDESLNQAVVKNAKLRRPLAKGVISPKEAKALPMFVKLLEGLLGTPVVPNEKVVYSVPAKPIDAKFDEVYHTGAINSVLSQLGYQGQPMNEGFGIVLSNLENENYTGIAISCGSGQTNVCISYQADEVASFSTARGGDFIDMSTAVSLGYDEDDIKNSEITPALVTLVKEGGVDISNTSQSDRIKNSIAIYYQNFIKYTVAAIIAHISSLQDTPRFQEPITVVISGGTSKAINFLSEFKKEFDNQSSKLPFVVKAVRHAENPLTAVAYGNLLALQAGL